MRRFLAAALIWLALTSHAFAAIGTPADLGHNQSASATSLAITTANAVATGDLIIVSTFSATTSATVSSITDTAGNTFVQCATSPATTLVGEIWYAKNATSEASSSTLTANWNGGASRHAVTATTVSGMDTTAPCDRSASNFSGMTIVNTSTGTSSDLTFPTLSVPNELLIIGYGSSSDPGTITCNNSYTKIGGGGAGVAVTSTCYLAVSVVTSSTPGLTWVNSVSARRTGATFRGASQPASAGTGGMMGVFP